MAAVNEIVLRVVVRDGQNATRIIRDIGAATSGMADITRQNATRTRAGLESISEQLANTRCEAIATLTGFVGFSALTQTA